MLGVRLGSAPLLLFLVLAPPAWADGVLWQWQGTNWIQGAEPLLNGNVLISDKVGNRVIEVVPAFPTGGTTVWEVDGLNSPDRTRRLANGNTLIADTANNRVLELDAAKNVVWSFGVPEPWTCDATHLAQPGDMDRLPNGDTIIPDEQQARILQVSQSGAITWYYGRSDCAQGIAPGEIGVPFSVQQLAGGDVLTVDLINHLVLQIRPTPPLQGAVVWQYGQAGVAGSGPNQLSRPLRALQLANGNVLIADGDNDRVIEVTPTPPSGGTIVWQYGVTAQTGTDSGFLSKPYDAHRLPNGGTLIADRDNFRVVLVVPDGAPARLTLSATPGELPALQCLGPLTVGVEDLTGSATQFLADTDVQLAEPSNQVLFFADAKCGTPITLLPIPAGTGQAQLYFRAVSPVTTVVRVAAAFIQPAEQHASFVWVTAFYRVGCSCGAAGGGEVLALATYIGWVGSWRRGRKRGCASA